MWRSYSAKRHTCMSVTRCKACSGQIGVSLRVAIEKMGNFNFNSNGPQSSIDNIDSWSAIEEKKGHWADWKYSDSTGSLSHPSKIWLRKLF